MRSLGRFELVRHVGTGVLGDTFLATAPDGLYMAVKKLHRGWGPPAEIGRRVAETSSRFTPPLTDPGTPGLCRAAPVEGGYDEAADQAWIATPWLSDTAVPGVTSGRAVSLRDMVAHSALPADAALHLVRQLAGLTRRLHAADLTLSGLKPSNVFLTAQHVVVVDIHMALALRAHLDAPGGPDPADAPAADSPPTAQHALFLWADPRWLPPELRRARARVRESSSIHALGTVTAYACTGLHFQPVIDLVDALAQSRADHKPAQEGLAAWAAKYGDTGTKVRRALLRSVRTRPWARPGSKSLERLDQRRVRKDQRRTPGWEPLAESVGSVPRHPQVPTPAPPGMTPLNAAPRRRALDAAPPASATDEATRIAGPPARQDAAPNLPCPPRDLPASSGTNRTHPDDPRHHTALIAPTTRQGVTRLAGGPDWTCRVSTPLSVPPTLVNGRLVVTGNGAAHAFDASTGEHQSTYKLGGPAESPPVLWDDRLWWALRDGTLTGHSVHGSAPAWRTELGGDPGRHTPVTIDGLLLVGTTHGLFWFGADRTASALSRGRLIRLDEPVVSPLATDGNRLFLPTERQGLVVVHPRTREMKSVLDSWDAAGCTPTPSGDGAWIGDPAGAVHHLGLAGSHARRQVSTSPITAAPVPHRDLLLVTDHDGGVIALSRDGQEPVWRAATDGDGRTAPAVCGDLVHVLGAHGVRRLDVFSGQEIEPLTEGGPRPIHVMATDTHLYVSHVDGLLSAWGHPR